MQQPNYTDLQYVNGALLNSGQAYIASSLKDLGYRLFSGGFINFNELTITPSNLTITVVAGSDFRLLDGSGNLAGFYGTTNGTTTDTLTVDFSSFVPGSGSQLVYLLASKLAITENPVAVIGPPIGHPDYNPANAPFTWNFETLDSIQLVASTTAPDNVTTFEVLRTTLTAGQTSITSYSTANARYAQPNQSVIVYAGNPNGNLAGVQGGNGVTPSIVWDTSDNLFWVCTTTGSDSTAVWIDAAGYLQIEAVIKGAGLTPDRTNTAQLLAALDSLFLQVSHLSVTPLQLSSATGVILTANYSDSKNISFTAPCAGSVLAFGKINLAQPAASSSTVSCALYINGTSVSSDTTSLSQSHFGSAVVTSGSSVSVKFSVSVNSVATGTGATYSVMAFFIPSK